MIQTRKLEIKKVNKSKTKFITPHDLYLQYPDKTYDIFSTTIPKPYFSADLITNNNNSLTYKNWVTIINCYLKHLLIFLIKGGVYNIPSKIGNLKMIKHKKKNSVNIIETQRLYSNNHKLPKNKKQYVYYKNRHTEGYIPLIRWNKIGTSFRFSRHWRFRFSKFSWQKVSKELMKTPSLINNYNNI